MGGQQFGTDTTLIDMNGMTRVVEFDRDKGEIEVEAGMQWPELYKYLVDNQRGSNSSWAFIQKQTGADKLSIGGALAANVHGRGLKLRPFVGDVVALPASGPTVPVAPAGAVETGDWSGQPSAGTGCLVRLFGPGFDSRADPR